MNRCIPNFVQLATGPQRELPVCCQAIVCQRCGCCIVHCVCPPSSERAKSDNWRRNRSGGLVVRPK